MKRWGVTAHHLKTGQTFLKKWDGIWDARCTANDSEILRRDSQTPISSGFSQEKKNACDFSQAQNLTPTGQKPDAPESVNYGVSCMSEEPCGHSGGHGNENMEKAILFMFQMLDKEGRWRVVKKLVEVMEGGAE